ncbi:hypothetical protein A8B82_11545 [Sulfitobacter sp. EhC04]|nr:hypothetical protein A8B82_11545 [Sulfitobacter sp. EhC04]
MRGWFGLAEKFDWHKARAIGPLITVAGTLIVGGLFILAIAAAFKLLGMAVFGEVPQDGFAKFGLTGIIVAMIGAPFVVWRSVVAQRQVGLADQALTNDKMDKAVADLHAQRQVTLYKGYKKVPFNGWEDDITRRNGAIDRFLGLVEENNSLRPRVDRMLTVYLRELTREFPADEVPDGADLEAIRTAVEGLTRKRSDMENAVQVLSRLPRPKWVKGAERLPDLQKINMQAFNLANLTLQGAHLSGAELQGANLSWAKLQGADLSRAQLQGAHLSWAQLQGAHLRGAQLQGAHLRGAELQGAHLSGAKLQGAHLIRAQLQGAHLIRAQLQGADLSGAELQGEHPI